MIWIAALTEAGIQNWPDMAILFGIQFINATLGFIIILIINIIITILNMAMLIVSLL